MVKKKNTMHSLALQSLKARRYYIWLSLSFGLASSLMSLAFFLSSDSNGDIDHNVTIAQDNLIRSPVIAEMITSMNETNIYNTTETLQRIPTRIFWSSGNLEAAEYLYNKLFGIPGLKVEYQGYGRLKNIIATLPGIDNSSDEIVMVGAHYDSISSDPAHAPGATDNACGNAIVVELARIMSQYKFNHTVAFALWNDEEDSQTGSNAYAENTATNSSKILLYLNFDSSCYDPNGHFILDIMYDNRSLWAKEMMTLDNRLYGINFSLTYNAHICASDHRNFWAHGYSAVMTHEETHGPGHTPSDTIDKVSTLYALKNGQLGMAILSQVAEVQGLRK